MPTGLTNWKTLISGIMAAAGGIASAFPSTAPYAHVITVIGTVALGYFAADAKPGA